MCNLDLKKYYYDMIVKGRLLGVETSGREEGERRQ
jgi:hypothetical protein